MEITAPADGRKRRPVAASQVLGIALGALAILPTIPAPVSALSLSTRAGVSLYIVSVIVVVGLSVYASIAEERRRIAEEEQRENAWLAENGKAAKRHEAQMAQLTKVVENTQEANRLFSTWSAERATTTTTTAPPIKRLAYDVALSSAASVATGSALVLPESASASIKVGSIFTLVGAGAKPAEELRALVTNVVTNPPKEPSALLAIAKQIHELGTEIPSDAGQQSSGSLTHRDPE